MLTREQVVNYFILYLRDRHPELDLRIGTAVRDLVLEPLADLFVEVLNDILRLSSFLTGEVEDKELLEKFLQNFFVERKYGRKASGSVRVYIAKKKIYNVPKGTKFFLDETHWFQTEQEYVIPESELLFNSFEGHWFFEVPVVAADVGVLYNVKKGTMLEPEPFDPFVLKAEAAIDFEGGEDVEPIEDFIKRAYQSLTLRNLISARSLKAVLPETFPDVLKVVPIGFGDPEMWRDYKEAVHAHIGGHTDVWLKFRTKPKRTTVRTDENGWILNAPGLLRILTPGVEVLEVDRHSAFGPNPKVRTNVRSGEIEVELVKQVSYVQTFLTRSDVRPMTVNFLARAMIPVYLSGTIRVVPGKGVSLESVKEKLTQWIYETDEFSISDLIDKLYDFGVEDVRTPVVLTATLITPEYKPLVFQVNDNFVYFDKEISPRTVTFYDGGINLVVA